MMFLTLLHSSLTGMFGTHRTGSVSGDSQLMAYRVSQLFSNEIVNGIMLIVLSLSWALAGHSSSPDLGHDLSVWDFYCSVVESNSSSTGLSKVLD